MTTLRTAWLLLLVFLYSGFVFANHGHSIEKQKEINRTDRCQNHITHTYQVFVPSVDLSCKSMPLMVVIDPHGDGKLAIKQFKEAAQTYAVVLIASNLVKNDVTGYLQLLDELIADAKRKYPVGNTLYFGGFSGGARMSLDYAMSRPTNGVIACGALAAAEQIKAIHCPVMAIVGMDDFNFIEAREFLLLLRWSLKCLPPQLVTPSNLLWWARSTAAPALALLHSSKWAVLSKKATPSALSKR